jgi:hypothetical protein
MWQKGEDGLLLNDFRRKRCFGYRWIVLLVFPGRVLGVYFLSNIDIGFHEYIFFGSLIRVMRFISVMSIMTAACALQYESRGYMSSL